VKVTSTEIQNNFGKYLQVAETQSVYIEKKGSDSIYKLEKVDKKEMLQETLDNLYGCLKGSGLENQDPDEVRFRKIDEKHGAANSDKKPDKAKCREVKNAGKKNTP
jgi:hypothetical protein